MLSQGQQRPASQFEQTIALLVSAGRSDAEIVAAHSFGWRQRVRARLPHIRAALSEASR